MRSAHAVGDAGDHHAAIGVPGQHDVAQVLAAEDGENVFDVQAEVDVAGNEMRPFALAGEGGGEDVMAAGAQPCRHLMIAPTTAPGAVHKDESGGAF